MHYLCSKIINGNQLINKLKHGYRDSFTSVELRFSWLKLILFGLHQSWPFKSDPGVFDLKKLKLVIVILLSFVLGYHFNTGKGCLW